MGRVSGVIMTSSVIDLSRTIKIIGTVSFIRLLLVMAGVEPNPGPEDQFNFRYQYLLIELGTKVLRNLLDYLVKNDFAAYLNANPKLMNHLQSLILKGVITTDQKRFLPPIDINPISANFDITLLVCLLRNVCGLRGQNDPVWSESPAPGDLSIEADIVRLRQCRNNLSHSNTVFISEIELTKRMTELTDILKRLKRYGNTSGSPTLSFDEAKQVCLDKDLKEKYGKAITAWVTLEKSFEQGIEDIKVVQYELKQGQIELELGQAILKQGLSELNHGHSELYYGLSELERGQANLNHGHSELFYGQSELKRGQDDLNQCQYELKQGQTELKHGQKELNQGQSELRVVQSQIMDSQLTIQSDINEMKEDKKYQTERMEINDKKVSECKDKLIDIYKKEYGTLSVAPLCDDDDDEVDLLTFYMTPELKRVSYHREQWESESVKVSSYNKIFCHDNQRFINIFITGNAGVGKTSFCRRMSLLWSLSHSGKIVDDSDLQKDIDFMKAFDFVFYVSLRETDQEDILDMIVNQFFYTKSAENREIMYKCIETIVKDFECLIILDALDEWTPKRGGAKECVLPKKIPSDRCKYLTTCRPYKIEQNRLSRKNIDCQIKMSGISGAALESYVRKIVYHVNEVNKEKKNPDDFLRETYHCRLNDLLHIPIIACHLILMWFDKTLTEMSTAQIYSNIIEMFFERTEKKDVVCSSSTDAEFQQPTFFSDLIFFKKHVTLIKKLCLLSFRSLFKQDQYVSPLLLNSQQLMQKPYFISAEDTDFLCKTGILSINKAKGRLGKKEQKLSFLHTSFIEFFAAFFVNSFDKNDFFAIVVKKWTAINDINEFGLFLIFLAGLSYQKTASVLEKIYLNISDSLNICRTNANVSFNKTGIIANFHKYCNMEEWNSVEPIRSLQNIVLDCCEEVRRSNVSCILFKFDDYIVDFFYAIPLLKQLCSFNQTCVNFLYSVRGKYSDEFDQIKHLEHLIIGKIRRRDYQKFEQMILQYQSIFGSFCTDNFRALGYLDSFNFMDRVRPDLPGSSLHHLTSLTLCSIKMPFHNYETLILFLNENVLIENIKLIEVTCLCFDDSYKDRQLSLRLTKHTKLNSLHLNQVDVLCHGENNSSLKFVSLHPLKLHVMRDYINAFESIKYSRPESSRLGSKVSK